MKSTPTILACILLWGLWAFFPKLATEYIPPVDALLYEIVAVIFVGLGVLALARPKLGRNRHSALAFAAGFVGGIGFLLYMVAVSKQDASIVAPVTAMYPVVPVVLGAVFLRERMSGVNWIGIVLALAAVLLISM